MPKIKLFTKYSYLFLLLFNNLCVSYAQNADINLLRDINLHRNNAFKGIMLGVTNSVYPVSVAIPVAELITGYATHNETVIIYGWQTIAGLGLNTAITFGLKYTVNRKRPYVTYPDIQPYQRDADPAFPSGHTSFSFCTATSLSLCFPKWYVIAPAYAWAATVGYSRMYLGMHYPTDVLAGAIIGAGSSWLAYKGNKWLLHRKKIVAVHEQ
jgi:membrane-associated phospholipid phosphatase